MVFRTFIINQSQHFLLSFAFLIFLPRCALPRGSLARHVSFVGAILLVTKCSAHPVHIDLQQKSLIPTSSCILTRVHIWCFPFTLAFIFCWFTSSSVCYHLIDVAVSGYLICSSSFLLSCKVSALIQFCFDLRKSSSVDCLCQTIAGLAYAGFLLLLVLLIFPLYLISILPFFSAKPLLCLTSPLRFVLYCTLSFFLHSF